MKGQVQKSDPRAAAHNLQTRGSTFRRAARNQEVWEGGGRSYVVRWYLVCLLLGFPLLLAGQKRHTATPDQTGVESPGDVEQGRALFKASCALCHGLDGKGATGPDLVRSPLVNHDVNGELIGPVIRNGRLDKGMPSQATMKPNQISDIAAFLHHQARVARQSSRLHGDYSLDRMLTGNALQGKAFFDGAGGCAQCHSVTGDLAGIGKKYSPIELEQKMVYPTSSNAPKMAVVTLKDRQRFQGKLVDQDEFNIGVICQDGWYRSWARDDVRVEIHDPLEAHRQLVFKYTDRDLHNVFAYLESLK